MGLSLISDTQGFEIMGVIYDSQGMFPTVVARKFAS